MIKPSSGSKQGPPVSTGQLAENRALAFLEAKGLKMVERNYRCRYGEIDLIMEEGPVLVFVEVRFRANARYGTAVETVDRRKQAKLMTTAASYLKASRRKQPTRFDVAALSPDSTGIAVTWVKNAFGAS
jgi:putative endonuclease